MVHQVGQRCCTVGTHGEGDQGYGEDWSAAGVAQADEQEAGNDVGEEAKEFPHEGG